MSTNYNSSQVGVKYVRANNITIQYPENGVPYVSVQQEVAVKLADGTIVAVSPFQSINFALDLTSSAAVQLVDPTTGELLGVNTNLQQLMLGILAVIREQQLLQNP